MSIKVESIKDFSVIKKMADEGYLYVMNNTTSHPSNGGKRGTYHMTVRDGNGDDFEILLPSTWIPIDIASQCPPPLVLNSQNFRRSITGDYLVVVSKEQAEKILHSADGRAEKEKVDAATKANNASGNRSGTVDINTGSFAAKDKASLTPNAAPDNKPSATEMAAQQSTQASSEFDMEAAGIIQEFNNRTITEKQAIIRLSKMEHLPSDDFLKELSNGVGSESANMFRYLGSMIGAQTVPTIEEVFGSESVLEDIQFT